LVRVRVDDAVKSYWPIVGFNSTAGMDVASDAVSVAWARRGTSTSAAAQRIWVLPFAKNGPELWTNTGVAGRQTPLEKLDPKFGVTAAVHETEDGYSVTLALPRKLMFAGGDTCVMNIAVHDNDEGAVTWTRSWAKEELGPAGWGRISLKAAATQPAATMRSAETKPAR
jgi:hypothetical protein